MKQVYRKCHRIKQINGKFASGRCAKLQVWRLLAACRSNLRMWDCKSNQRNLQYSGSSSFSTVYSDSTRQNCFPVMFGFVEVSERNHMDLIGTAFDRPSMKQGF